MCKGVLQGELEWQIIPAFSKAENFAWVEASFSGSKRWDLVKTGKPGLVRIWWQTS